jgi:hypothetical protein
LGPGYLLLLLAITAGYPLLSLPDNFIQAGLPDKVIQAGLTQQHVVCLLFAHGFVCCGHSPVNFKHPNHMLPVPTFRWSSRRDLSFVVTVPYGMTSFGVVVVEQHHAAIQCFINNS